jgi:hypothetical protein
MFRKILINNNTRTFLAIFLVNLLPLTVEANNHSPLLYPAEQVVYNLTGALNSLKQKTKVPVKFVREIPKGIGGNNYYVYTEITDRGYRIYIDYQSDCKGIHSCNVGFLTAEKDGKLESYTDRNNNITVSIKLKDRAVYFTPAHSMGDYWPTNLQWQDNNVWYKLSWQLDPKTEQKVIIAMAKTLR